MDKLLDAGTAAIQLTAYQLLGAFALGCLFMGCLAWFVYQSLRATRRTRDDDRHRRELRARIRRIIHS